MRRAVDVAKRSIPEDGRVTPVPRVGVVIVKGGTLLGESFRGATGSGDHAEYGLLKQLADVDLSGADVYTTLEPCSRRNPPKRPCAEWLIDRGIGTVYIGLYDPNPTIYREGWRLLRDAGIGLRDFEADLRSELVADNALFLDSFRTGKGEEGEARLDYMQNDGRFEVTATDGSHFSTRWGARGPTSVYARAPSGGVALARYAAEFAEIDDPAALHFTRHFEPVEIGEIVAFKGTPGFLLAKVVEVHGGPRCGADRTEVRFVWQVRVSA
jgi:pyrimidine deaminase RibD-like protein